MSGISAATVSRECLADEAQSLDALLLARCVLYSFFHRAFGGEPSVELLNIATSVTMADILDEYAEENADMAVWLHRLSEVLAADEVSEEALVSSARDEYTRAFVGPGKLLAIPWKSPYVTGDPSLFHERTLDVRTVYRKHGLQPRKLQHVPDDHIALLCDFMEHMAQETLQAFEQGLLSDLEGYLDVQIQFVRDHMLSWLPQFADMLSQSKRADFYESAAHILTSFAEMDVTFLAQMKVWFCDSEENGSEAEVAEVAKETASLYPDMREFLARAKGLSLKYLEDYELVSID